MKNNGLFHLFKPFSLKTVHPSDCSLVRNKSKCHLTSIRELLKIVAQILVPFMIGIFTIVIAVQQHNLNKENRRKDLDIAHQLRQQQFELDEHRRAQELTLDEARRTQDLSIADNKQRDAVFSVYIRDLSNLLLINNYVLNRATLNSIVRPMTLTILRQLDPARKVLLVKFLYESKMLRADCEETRVDLSDGDLNGIHLGRIRMTNLSLPGTLMVNASFVSTDLAMADFQGADLTDASFLNADLTEVNFYRARLIRVRFPGSHLTFADLALADLTQSTIAASQLQISSSYNMATMPDGSEGENNSLIYPQDKCGVHNWNIRPKGSVNLTDQCHFVVLKSNTTMTYRIPLFFHRRLIAKQEALLQFRFRAKMNDEKFCRVDFAYFDEEQDDEIHREAGTIISIAAGTSGSFRQYEVSAGYPSDGFYLYLQMFLNIEDILTDFDFYIQHFDFSQYRHE